MNLSKEMNEIKNVFNNTVPLIFTVMAERQILPTYWPVIKDALIEDRGIQDPLVKNGLMAALSSRCGNSYCFVSHSYYLYGLGFSVKTIENLINELKYPAHVVEHDKWSSVLKWTFLFSHTHGEPADADDHSNEVIRRLTRPPEYRALFKICSVSDILNRFSEFYSNKVRIENEETFLDPSTKLKLPIPDLAKFYVKISKSPDEAERPVVTICMYCKNIRDAEGKWHALESMLSALDRKSAFSHSICNDCIEKRNPYSN